MNIIAIILLVVLVSCIFILNRKKVERNNFKNTEPLDKKFIQSKWMEIEETFKLGSPSNAKVSIMEADKLIDYVLKSKGVRGDNFGERLKNSKAKFTNYADYDNLWFAHKVRNNIAHEANHELNSSEAKRAVEYFKKALIALGAL